MAGKAWPERPKSLSERGYRKYMAKTKEITIGEQKFTLQSVSPSWYYDFNDECGNTGGRRVALLAEGVGRNRSGTFRHLTNSVALLTEGVGRNLAVVPLLSTVITKKISTKEKNG